jgi:hypothetical protein
MSGIKTLADRAFEFRARLTVALGEIDAALTDYARRVGGRFIRYGSTTTGRATSRSDVDIIAEFPDDRVSAACRFADDLCLDRKLLPDVRPAQWCSPELVARAASEGVVLA